MMKTASGTNIFTDTAPKRANVRSGARLGRRSWSNVFICQRVLERHRNHLFTSACAPRSKMRKWMWKRPQYNKNLHIGSNDGANADAAIVIVIPSKSGISWYFSLMLRLPCSVGNSVILSSIFSSIFSFTFVPIFAHPNQVERKMNAKMTIFLCVVLLAILIGQANAGSAYPTASACARA